MCLDFMCKTGNNHENLQQSKINKKGMKNMSSVYAWLLRKIISIIQEIGAKFVAL